MGILPMSTTGILPVQNVEEAGARRPCDSRARCPCYAERPSSTGCYGQWIYKDPNSFAGWVTGHWVGCLWWQYDRTRDGNMLQAAKDWTNGMEFVKNNPLDADIGFRFMNSFYLAQKLLDDTTDPGRTYRDHAKAVLIQAATGLDTWYNRGGIPVGELSAALNDPVTGWNQPYGVNVDMMMNISLLFEGWKQSGSPATGTPKTWYDHAVSHALKTLEQNVRRFDSNSPRFADNGSTYHTVHHNNGYGGLPADGNVCAKRTLQGFGNESTWARGQAWAVYGYTQTYSYTRDDPDANVGRTFLDAACLTADYFLSHLPNNYTADWYNTRLGDFVPPGDFDAALGEPNGPWNDADKNKVYGDRLAGTHAFVARDTSAASIAASALLELSEFVTDPNLRTTYFDAAEDILWCLMTYDANGDGQLDYLARDSDHMGILAAGTSRWDSPQQSLIFGDYYFLEALARYEAIPEPATAALLLACLGGVLLRRRRRET